MLTLKSKFETLEEDKILSRAASVWTFFWGQVLPVSRHSKSRIAAADQIVPRGCLPTFQSGPRSPIDIPCIRIESQLVIVAYSCPPCPLIRLFTPYPATPLTSTHTPLVESHGRDLSSTYHHRPTAYTSDEPRALDSSSILILSTRT